MRVNARLFLDWIFFFFKIQMVRDMMSKGSNIVAFAGAGVSVKSSIPTYRGVQEESDTTWILINMLT